jgi:hypothetical protein
MQAIRIVPYASPESRELLTLLLAKLYGPHVFCRAN